MSILYTVHGSQRSVCLSHADVMLNQLASQEIFVKLLLGISHL